MNDYKDKELSLPQRKTRWSAGYDLAAAEEVTIPAGAVAVVPTGLKAYMEADEVLMLHIRSSLALKQGLVLANGTGIIDADYVDNPDNEGHILLAVYNRSRDPVTIRKGERVAQGIFVKYLCTDDDCPGGDRLGGFGSTGET
ncbi:MAG TPA: dUTP diphosphatase [Clostridia bacterium]|nr:dUTP diphosphatase [Clostridia bacterium]